MSQSPKKTILLAEDDDAMRRFVDVILKNAGYQTLTAEDGLVAMEKALAHKIDALVADAIMPNLSGYDLCRMIHSNADNDKVPCIILSGLTQTDPNPEIADVFLLKDTDLKENLLAALEKLL